MTLHSSICVAVAPVTGVSRQLFGPPPRTAGQFLFLALERPGFLWNHGPSRRDDPLPHLGGSGNPLRRRGKLPALRAEVLPTGGACDPVVYPAFLFVRALIPKNLARICRKSPRWGRDSALPPRRAHSPSQAVTRGNLAAGLTAFDLEKTAAKSSGPDTR